MRLWVLDEGMTQMMFLVPIALKRVVQQWALADLAEVVKPLKRVDEGEMCAISLEVVTPRKGMVQPGVPSGIVIMRLMTTAHWRKSSPERWIACYFVIWNWYLGCYEDFYLAWTAAEDGKAMRSRDWGCQVD